MFKIINGSIRAYAPTKLGAIMLYVGDADFSTDIMGNSLESNVALDVPYLSLLAIDDVNSHHIDLHEAKGVSYWKVSKSKSLR